MLYSAWECYNEGHVSCVAECLVKSKGEWTFGVVAYAVHDE